MALMKRLTGFLRDSVRGRLLLLVLAMAAPAVLLVVVLVLQAFRSERQSVGEHLIATARAVASLVDHQLGESEAMLRGLAASRDVVDGNFNGLAERARSLVRGPDRWIVVSEASGQQRVNTRLPPGAPLPKDTFDPEFVAVVSTGRMFISNVVVGKAVERPVVYVSVPVMEAGVMKYVLSYAMLPEAFAGMIDPARFSPDTVVTVLDRNGIIVTRHPNAARFTGARPMPDIYEAVRKRVEIVRESVTLEGQSVLAAYSPAPVSGWGVALGAPISGLYSSARSLLWTGLIGSAILLGVALLMTLWIGRALVRGVDTLVEETEIIGRGEVPSPRSSGLAETDFVVDAMRRTAQRLEERDRENATLTEALQGELAKQKLSESANRQLAAIVAWSDDAIISKDLDGVIISWNRGAERVFGYTAREAIGRPILMLLSPGQEGEETTILERLRRGEIIDHFETVRSRKDGSLVPISLMVSPLRDDRGMVVGASTIARDITPRRRAEAQQQTMYELVARVNRAAAMPAIYEAALDAMERCLDSTRAAILLLDDAKRMQFVASRGLSDSYRVAASGHSPWDPAETNAQPIWINDTATADLPPPLVEALAREGIRALVFFPLKYEQRLQGKFMVYFERPHVFTPEELRPVETIASQVAFAIERQRGAEALEALVNERTASLRQAVEQMEEFSYSVSHDLRAPVRAMRGYADIVLQDFSDRLSPEGRELLARIIRNGTRMDRLIQDLLTYSRVSRRELRLERVSLDKLVQEVLQQYPDMAPEKADITLAAPLPEVIAHEPSLAQVISNLLSNAVKFVPPGRRPQVRIVPELRDGRVRVAIIDNGIGIKPEHQVKLFGLFERIHPERDYEGTGIGLAIVRRAVERMNGTAGMHSDGVSGSTFWFELPLA